MSLAEDHVIRYFAWDTIESIVHYSGAGFVAHGFSCFVIYLLSFVSHSVDLTEWPS